MGPFVQGKWADQKARKARNPVPFFLHGVPGGGGGALGTFITNSPLEPQAPQGVLPGLSSQ